MTRQTGPFRLSACMMVKDEEANLPRCLQSIQSFVDEIIVVDTGSSDRTVDIAKSFGASIYHHAWANNFSLHRNQSIEPATGDWILIIDADEELVFGKDKINHIRTILQEATGEHAFAIVMKNIQEGYITSQTIHPRFFRNGTISYTGIVHNQPVFKGTASLFLSEDVFLNHYGYGSENIEKKAERTIPLLEQQLKENPKNWQCYYYLSQIYGNLRQPKKAIEMGQVYIDHKNDVNVGGHENFQHSIYTSMLSSFMELGYVDAAISLLDKAIREAPDDLDIARNEVEIGVWTQNPIIVLHGTYRFIDLYAKYQKDFRTAKNYFIHSFTPDAMAYCLKQCICLCIQIFKKVIPEAETVIGNGMMEDFKKFLKDQDLV